MTKPTFAFFIVFGLAINFLQAQDAPGYMGKKAIFSLNYSSSVALFGPTLNDRGQDDFYDEVETILGVESNLGLNYEFGADFSYTLTRQRALSLGYHQYATNTVLEWVYTNVDFDYLYRLNVRAISLNAHQFKRKRGGLAPLGNSSYWGLKTTFINGEEADSRMINFVTPPPIPESGAPEDPNLTVYSLLWGISNQQIFWDKLVLKMGVHISIPLTPNYYRFIIDPFSISTVEEADFQLIYEAQAITRIARHEALRFDIGVGYLLF